MTNARIELWIRDPQTSEPSVISCSVQNRRDGLTPAKLEELRAKAVAEHDNVIYSRIVPIPQPGDRHDLDH